LEAIPLQEPHLRNRPRLSAQDLEVVRAVHLPARLQAVWLAVQLDSPLWFSLLCWLCDGTEETGQWPTAHYLQVQANRLTLMERMVQKNLADLEWPSELA
jgi:hypothetical protein